MDIAGAEKKLRQAQFFLDWLEYAPKDAAYQHPRGEREHLEFYFSACLSAAKSVYYVLDETGGEKFKETQRQWRAALNDDERLRFGRMMGLRDDDVHLATTGAQPLQKYISDDSHSRSSPYYGSTGFHVPMFGSPAVIEEENPDGVKVRGSVLRGTIGLYIDHLHQGQRVEAATACREFISQLRSLVEVMKATG